LWNPVRQVPAVELEYEIDRRYVSDVLHSVRFSRRVEDDTVGPDAFTQRFNRSFQHDDGYVMCVDMRGVTGPGLERRHMGLQAAKALRLAIEDLVWGEASGSRRRVTR
jgi:hypothetical protein